MLEWLRIKRHALISSLGGGLTGALFGIMSYEGLLDFLHPVARGLLGLAVFTVIGLLLAPVGFARGEPPSRSGFAESAIASAISGIVSWPVVYTMLAAP